MKGILKQLEVGVLLTEDSELFTDYNQVYVSKTHNYSFFDEDCTTYMECEMNQAIKDAINYVLNGVDMTYAIIANQGKCEYNTEDEEFSHDYCDIEFAVAKIDGNIVVDFIGIDNPGYNKIPELQSEIDNSDKACCNCCYLAKDDEHHVFTCNCGDSKYYERVIKARNYCECWED